MEPHGRNMSGTAASIAGPYLVTLTSIGIVINLLVIVTFARHKLLLNSNNFLVMLLSISDLMMATTSFPFIAASSIENRWLFSTAGCVWYAASMTSLGLTSMSLLMCIALERYIVIAVKRREASSCAKSRAKKFAVVCFVWGIFLGVCPLIGWGSYDLEPVFPSCTPVWWRRDTNNFSFVMVIFTSAFFVPVVVISIAYIGIFIKVRTVRREGLNSSSRSSKEIRVAIVSLLMIVSFILSWGPYAVVALLQVFWESFYVPDILNIMPIMMAKSSVVWNPIIYLGTNKKFQQAFVANIVDFKSSLKKWKCSVLHKTRNRVAGNGRGDRAGSSIVSLPGPTKLVLYNSTL